MIRRRLTDNIYRKYEDFVYWRAYSWNKTTGAELEELAGIAALNFIESFKSYDPSKAKLTTYARKRIDNAIKDWVSRERFEPELEEHHPDFPTSSPLQESNVKVKELLVSLSDEAKEVVLVVLTGLTEAFELTGDEKVSEIRRKIKAFLIKKYPINKANSIMKEIRLAVAEHL